MNGTDQISVQAVCVLSETFSVFEIAKPQAFSSNEILQLGIQLLIKLKLLWSFFLASMQLRQRHQLSLRIPPTQKENTYHF